MGARSGGPPTRRPSEARRGLLLQLYLLRAFGLGVGAFPIHRLELLEEGADPFDHFDGGSHQVNAGALQSAPRRVRRTSKPSEARTLKTGRLVWLPLVELDEGCTTVRLDGRLLTNRPISSFSVDNSLIGNDLLGGSAVYLQIDYETMVDGFEQTASGGRIRHGLREWLAVGATAIDEDQIDGQYSLTATDVELKLGGNSRLIAEYATSEGNNSVVNISEDGGLSYQTVAPVVGSAGDAYKIAAEIDAGQWFGVEDRLLLNTYFKHLDTGFSA